MKKGFILVLLVFAVSWFASCEKDVYDINPTMEAYYMESLKLPSVTLDPWAVEHKRYPQIKENIKVASIRINITINDEWDGDTIIYF